MYTEINRFWYTSWTGKRYYKDERVLVIEPRRSRQEMDEIDYISEIAMDLMETDPEDRRPKNWKR